MTTKFNSFDASPLGAFVESPLGARNRPRPPGDLIDLIVLIVWIDEADVNYYQNPDQYFAHKAQWEAALQARDGDRVLAFLWYSPIAPILPFGAAYPRGVTVRFPRRVLSGAGMLNQLASDVPESYGVAKIRISIDDSPSFNGWPRLEDAVTHFFVRAQERWGMGPFDTSVIVFHSQNWVQELTNGLEELLPP